MNNRFSNKSELRQALHDIRNPLNTISVNADLAKLCLEQQDDKDLACNAIDSIREQCLKLAEILNKIESE